MNKFLSSKFLLIMILTISLFYSGCIGKDTSIPDFFFGSKISVYGELQVTDQWQEIKLTKTFETGGPIRFLVLEIKDGRSWQGFGEREAKSPQGEVIDIEAQMIDEQGRVYELKPNHGRPDQMHLWVDFQRDKDDNYFPKSISGEANKDVTFTKLRIKSNYSFTCTEIYWESRGV